MRIDKYLWSIRVFKSRKIASDHVKANKVSINGQVVKASREVMPGDKLEVRKAGIRRAYRVLDLPPSRVGAKIVGLYMQETTSVEELEREKVMRQTQTYYRQKGLGRPTKRDKRQIDDYLFDTDNEDII